MKLRLVGIDYGAEHVNVYRFSSPDGVALPEFDPGAHVDLEIVPGLSRQYSLLWPAPDRSTYAIAVQYCEDGRGGSRSLHRDSVVGQLHTVSEPRNHFALRAAPGAVYCLLAGGIGITPIVSMYRRLSASGARVCLYYWTKTPERMPFLAELAGLAAVNPADVHLIHTASGAVAPRLAEVISRMPRDTQLYCCGPTRMIDEFDALTAGRPADHVHRERFGTAAPVEQQAGDTFVASLRRSGLTLTVAPDQTLLNACLAAGVDVSYSCEEGVCGACEVRVLSGKVQHRDQVLSPAQQAASETMMICCSRGVGPIELDA